MEAGPLVPDLDVIGTEGILNACPLQVGDGAIARLIGHRPAYGVDPELSRCRQ